MPQVPQVHERECCCVTEILWELVWAFSASFSSGIALSIYNYIISYSGKNVFLGAFNSFDWREGVQTSGVIIVHCGSADSYGLACVASVFGEKVGTRAKKRNEGGRGGERRKHEKMQGVIGRTSIPAWNFVLTFYILALTSMSFRDFPFL